MSIILIPQITAVEAFSVNQVFVNIYNMLYSIYSI